MKARISNLGHLRSFLHNNDDIEVEYDYAIKSASKWALKGETRTKPKIVIGGLFHVTTIPQLNNRYTNLCLKAIELDLGDEMPMSGVGLEDQDGTIEIKSTLNIEEFQLMLDEFELKLNEVEESRH